MNSSLPNAVVSELIGSVYDCALDPARWPDTMTKLREALNFRIANLGVVEPARGRMRVLAASGIEPEWLRQLEQYGPSILEQWGGENGLRQLPCGDVYMLSRSCPNPRWKTSHHRLEWALPQGIVDTMVLLGGVSCGAGSFSIVSLGRHKKAEPITEPEIDAARLLAPHVRRATTIGGLLDNQTLRAATMTATLDTLASAVLLVGPGMRLIHANCAAEAMLSANDTLRVRGGVLALSSPAACAALAGAVAQAAANEAAIGRRGLNVPLLGRNGEARVFHVLPLRRGPLRSCLAPTAVAAVFVAPALFQPTAHMDAIEVLFGLTAAEAAVLEHIAAGRDVARTATAMGIGAATVRTHVRHLFDKTGVRRQAELVALVSSLSLPVQS